MIKLNIGDMITYHTGSDYIFGIVKRIHYADDREYGNPDEDGISQYDVLDFDSFIRPDKTSLLQIWKSGIYYDDKKWWHNRTAESVYNLKIADQKEKQIVIKDLFGSDTVEFYIDEI
jgi:hypothetical protein